MANKHQLSEKQKTQYRNDWGKVENQFKVSISQHIENMYENACESFSKAEIDLKESPKSHLAKGEWARCLSQKQTLEALIHHIEDGSYDSEEFYTNYLNPKTRFQQINSSLNK